MLSGRQNLIRRLLVILCLGALALPASRLHAATPQTNKSAITPDEQKGIDSDIAEHDGDAPANPGPKAKLSPALKRADVQAAMGKVAQWELAVAQPFFDRTWTWSTLYAGFMAASPALEDARYRVAMEAMANKFDWQLRSEHPNADDQSVGQTYLELYMLDPAQKKIAPTQTALDSLLAGAEAPIPEGQAHIAWWWCDALFMAPPVWSRMFAATHDTKYLDYLDKHWWETSGLLYDPHHHLYFRDVTWLHKTDDHGNPIFWSRGNGWVMAGLARTLEYMPKSYPDRARFENQLREMAAAIKPLQDRRSGMWHSSLLDADDYPQPETSGSALMTFALAWGVNQGILNRKEYRPVIARAWRGLVEQIYADGRLGNIQQTGAGPGHYLPSSSFNYGVGGFLLAGAQVEQLSAQGH